MDRSSTPAAHAANDGAHGPSAIATGQITISSKASSAKTGAIARAPPPPSAIATVRRQYSLSGSNLRQQRLLFAILIYCAPTNVAPEKSVGPFYAIDSRICSFTRVSNVATKRGYR